MPRRSLLSISALAALFLVLLIYLPGAGGALYYDDYNALDRMSAVADYDSAREFILGGTAGPLGRPVALLSYLPHAAGWPDNSSAVLLVNILIHCTNALLFGLLAWLVLSLRPEHDQRRDPWIALGAALLWAVLPIIASASLIAIQRMTTLAASFGLLGLIGFLFGYRLRGLVPGLRLALQFGALGLGTLTAMFTKESGALIPVYALVLDAVLLRHLQLPRPWQRMRRWGLWLAFLTLLAFVAWRGRDLFTVAETRGFSPWDRLQTEAVIVWEYLRLTIMPLPTAFGPFHDHRSGSEYTGLPALLGMLAWLALLAAAWWTNRRWHNPWPLFALLWFFTGHLLESTTIMLEPYFEHRNYMATFGLCLMFAVGAGRTPGRLGRAAPALLVGAIVVNAAILYSMTSLWGKPLEAARMWTERNPASARAALHSVFVEFGDPQKTTMDLNEAMILHERRRFAIAVLDRTAGVCPRCLDVQAQALLYACFAEQEPAVDERFEKLLRSSAEGSVNISTVDGLFALDEILGHNACPPLTGTDVVGLIDRLLARERHIDAGLRVRMLFLAAKIAEAAGNTQETEMRLTTAETVAPQALPVLQFQVYLYNKLGRFTEAMAAIDRRRDIDRSDSAMTDTVLAELARTVETARGKSPPRPSSGEGTPRP